MLVVEGGMEGEWRESAPLGPAAAPLRPGAGYEGSAPLARPWAHDGFRSHGAAPKDTRGTSAIALPGIHAFF